MENQRRMESGHYVIAVEECGRPSQQLFGQSFVIRSHSADKRNRL